MRTLAWMQKRFWKHDEQSTNVPTGKYYSCFSALWELDEKHYPEANNNDAQFRQPIAHGVEAVKEEELVEMKPEFFHGLLAIGTLGSVIVTKDPITPKPATDEEETNAGEQFLNKKLEKLTERELEKDTKENKNMIVYSLKEFYEMPAIKEDEKKHKAALEHTLEKNATSYKRSGKLDKGVKRETRVFHFMKKMLKKIDFTSRCSTTSAFRSNAISCDSTEKTPTKVFQKSKKIHPDPADIHVNKSHKYEVKKMCYADSYDKKVTSDDEDMYHQDGMFQKETISSNMFAHRPFNSQPAGRKAHWIKTDADYFVLEF